MGDGDANRIAQYEMGYRVSKKPLLIKMAEALAVSPLALLEPSNRNISGIMETLFWMDEDMGGVLQFTTVTYDGPEDPEELEEPRLTGNITVPASGFPPTVLWTENAMLDGFLRNGATSSRLTMGEKLPMTSILNGKSAGPWILKSGQQGNSLKQNVYFDKKQAIHVDSLLLFLCGLPQCLDSHVDSQKTSRSVVSV